MSHASRSFRFRASEVRHPLSTFNTTTNNANDHTNAPTKELLVRTYLCTVNNIPCKYFQASLDAVPGLGSNYRSKCKFYNDYHYAHIDPRTGAAYVFMEKETADEREAKIEVKVEKRLRRRVMREWRRYES